MYFGLLKRGERCFSRETLECMNEEFGLFDFFGILDERI